MFEVSDGLGFYVAVSILLLFSEDNAVLVFKKYDFTEFLETEFCFNVQPEIVFWG